VNVSTHAPRSEGLFEVVGARAALNYFGALGPDGLSHGYLFTGPAGVGKKTFARALAQSLLCETPKATLLGYCNRCPGCTLFRAGTHPDFVASEGTVKIGKEPGSAQHDEELTARDLVRELSLRGYRSDHRVVLLGDVDFATHEAANALLKFFEEPPRGVVVLLTSSAPGTLPETIRSRFVEIVFVPLTLAEVESVLRADGVDAARAKAAAEASFGSITRARAVLEGASEGIRAAAFGWFVDAMLGRAPDHAFLQLDDRSLSAADKRALVAEMLEIVRIAARDWATLGVAADAPLLAPDQRALLARIPMRSLPDVAALLGAIAETRRLAETNVSAGLVVDYLRMQLVGH
jgi:DNA polymerase-3 subunit delta'